MCCNFAMRITLCVLLAGLSACTSMVPRKDLPYPLSNRESGDPVKVVSIPLPIIASSPNEGVTSGALTAFLIHDKQDEINTLLAPQVNYNPNFGTTATLYGAFYPTPELFWEFNLSKSTKVNDDVEVRFRDTTFFNNKLELNGFAFYSTDGSARFFGFQSSSPKEGETNYADQEFGFNVSAGYKIGKFYQLVFGERLKGVNVMRGAIPSLPFIRDRYTPNDVPGIDGFTAHAQRLAFVYSTLNSPHMPTFGGYAKVSVENSLKVLGSTADYRHYEVEAKGFIPLDDARYVSAFRLAYNQTLGSSVPFLERSILGGETTLRGYGRNRFIDNSYFLLNLEERIRLFRWEVFGVTADWEMAPFVDLGSVMKSLAEFKSGSFEFNPGLGVRAVVRPNLIGRVDVGWGNDGPAVFVGLGYPF